MTVDRRRFLALSAGTAGATVAIGAAGTIGLPSLFAADPISRGGSVRLRMSLAAYSFRQKLDLKAKPKPAWTLLDFIDFAAENRCDAVELTAYYFAETSPKYLADLKYRCIKHGLEVSGTAVGNNFCAADPAKVKSEIEMVKAWVEHTSRLGGKTIRIFAGNPPKGEAEDKVRERCVPAIREACDHAAKYGIFLALENHDRMTGSAERLEQFHKAVNHPAFGINLDSGNFHTADPYADIERIAPLAVNAQIKTEVRAEGKETVDADIQRIVTALRKANYKGYVALEYEAKEDALTAVPRHLQTLRKLLG